LRSANDGGYREILGICEGAKEDNEGWSAFLEHLKERALKGVRLIISDACLGLAERSRVLARCGLAALCIVHWYRNIFSHVLSTEVREIVLRHKGDASKTMGRRVTASLCHTDIIRSSRLRSRYRRQLAAVVACGIP
jgi:transposase-like protein